MTSLIEFVKRMHLGHWLVTLGRAKQSQLTPQEIEYVADTDIKYTFLMELFIQITEETKKLKHTIAVVIRQMWVSFDSLSDYYRLL